MSATSRRVGGGLADMFSDNLSLENEFKRNKKIIEKKKSIFDDQPTWAFPSSVSMIVIAFLPTHNRDTLNIHRLITDNRMVVHGTPQEHVEKKLFPRLVRLVGNAKAQGQYDAKIVFGRFIAEFSFCRTICNVRTQQYGTLQRSWNGTTPHCRRKSIVIRAISRLYVQKSIWLHTNTDRRRYQGRTCQTRI